MAYESKQAILEEAGFSHVVTGETPSGLINGVNKVFTVAHVPMTDTNYDDTTDTSDATVFVNSATVTVSALDPDAGQITLAAAPPNGATLTVNYRYSPITDQAVSQVQQEAGDLVDERLANIDRPATSATIRKIVRYYASGLLLARDYGFQSDTAQTSKDGYHKMELVEGKDGKPGWLEAYAQLLFKQEEFAEGGDEDLVTAEVSSDPDIFTTWDSTTSTYLQREDDIFMRGVDIDG